MISGLVPSGAGAGSFDAAVAPLLEARYRVTLDAYPYQATSTVTLTLFQGNQQGVATAALNEMIGSFDLVDAEGRVVEVTPYLRPRDLVAPSLADVYRPPDDKISYFQPQYNVQDYPWEGIALRWMTIEGPLYEDWPPPSTRELLAGIEFDRDAEPVLTKDPYEHVVDVVARFGPRAFRRPLTDGELETYADLAKPALEDGLPFLDAVREPLRALLIAPSFVYHVGSHGEPGWRVPAPTANQSARPSSGARMALDDFQVATRLSYTANGVMIPAETSRAKLFKNMFLDGDPGEVERESRNLASGGSILDRVKAEASALPPPREFRRPAPARRLLRRGTHGRAGTERGRRLAQAAEAGGCL